MLSVGFIGGSQLNVLLLKRFNSRQIFRVALFIQVITSLLFLIGSLNDWYNVTSTIILLFILLLCLGFTSPNALALALEPITINLGSASALIGTIRIGTAGFASAGIGLLHTTTITPVAFMMASTVVVAVTIFLVGGQMNYVFDRRIKPGTRHV